MLGQHDQSLHTRISPFVVIFKTSLIVLRRKYWIKTVVHHHEGEPDGRGREPVEEILKQLDGDGVGQVGLLVDARDVEVRNVVKRVSVQFVVFQIGVDEDGK